MTDQVFDTGDDSSRSNNDKSFYAWTDVPILTGILKPGIMHMLFLKLIYLNDIKHAKNTLIIWADCPNFPDALWFDVLLNKYIDLDKIFAGHYALESNSPQVQSASEPNATIGINMAVSPANISKNSKTIQSHGNWTIAYASAKEAILFSFPHRLKELCEYKKFIIGLFATVTVLAKYLLVMQLDRAICLHVTHSNDMSFMCYHKFNDLVACHLAMGAQSSPNTQPA